jgi:hypothetical protein
MATACLAAAREAAAASQRSCDSAPGWTGALRRSGCRGGAGGRDTCRKGAAGGVHAGGAAAVGLLCSAASAGRAVCRRHTHAPADAMPRHTPELDSAQTAIDAVNCSLSLSAALQERIMLASTYPHPCMLQVCASRWQPQPDPEQTASSGFNCKS